MTGPASFTAEEARRIGERIGIDYYTRLEAMDEQTKRDCGLA